MAKIRNGFVSNSSSSSFLIYGACIKNVKSFIPQEVVDAYAKRYECEADDIDSGELLNFYLKDSDMGYRHPCESDYYFIGKSWDMIKDDQTGKEFKEYVEVEIKKLFGNDVNCGTLEAAWDNR